jgi:hypothetical protein
VTQLYYAALRKIFIFAFKPFAFVLATNQITIDKKQQQEWDVKV